MRRLLAVLLMLASPALAAEPVAKVAGPTTATVGVPIYLDVSGSVCDPDTPLIVDFGDAPDKPSARILSGDDRRPTDVKVTATKPGIFYAVVIAKGKPTPESETVTRIAVLPLTVTDGPVPPSPGPAPTPDPRPPVPPPVPPPTPSPLTIGEQLGRSFGPKLAASLAEGFETAATMIAAGTPVRDADETLKAKFAAARAAAFYDLVAPTFAAVVPAGSEPKDAATRAAFAELHRDFAKGLRGAK